MSIGGVGGPSFGGFDWAAKATSPAAGMFAAKTEAPTGAKAEFLKRAQMSAAEQMRAQILDRLGVTEDELKAMKPEDRAKIEEKIKDMIKTQVEQDAKKKGVIVDIKA